MDINVDGLAHYGLVPDLLQDITNLGISSDIRRALFSSAEHFLQTWEKVERVSGAPNQDWFSPLALPCEVICRGLCPASPDAGAPHRR